MLFLICFLPFANNIHAQQEWEYINKQFGTWQIGSGLSSTSNSLEKLNIRNTTNEGIVDTQKNLNYRSAVLNMNWKNSTPFEISFTLSNEKTEPYQYSQEEVYWGLSLELYKADGSVVSDKIWLAANKFDLVADDGIIYRYFINTNSKGWEKWKHSEREVKNMNINITCFGNSLSAKHEYYSEYIRESKAFATQSNIVGVKSISVMVGSGAEVSVTDFFVKKESLHSKVKPFIDKGDEYMDKQMWNEAVKEYTKAINQNYRNKDIYLSRAYANMMSDYNVSAIEDANRALSFESNNEVAYFIRGVSKLKNDDDSGVSDLRKAGENGIALLKELDLLNYYPNQGNSDNSNTQRKTTSSSRSALKKDPNFKIK